MFSDEQKQLLQDSIDRYFSDHYDFEFRQKTAAENDGYSLEHWQRYAEFGWLGIPFAEDEGGFGGSLLDTLHLSNTFGRVLALEPFLSTVTLAGRAIAAGDNAALKERVIPELIAGEAIASLAYEEPQSRGNPSYIAATATPVEQGYRLTGDKVLALNAPQARYLVVAARTQGAVLDQDGIGLFLVDTQETPVAMTDYTTVDGWRAANISFDVTVSKDNVIAEAGGALLDRVIREGILVVTAEALGIIKALLDVTVEYTSSRKQFGVPLASFQVLNHKIADMFIQYQQLSALFEQTVRAVEQGDEVSAESVHLLKAQLGKSGRFVGEAAIHLHGGMGTTDELNVGHYVKRLLAIDGLFGNTDFHLKQLWREAC